MLSRLLLLALLQASLVTGLSSSYNPYNQKGLQVRVCQDRDCLTDGGKEALSILEDLSQGSQAEVISCGCIGPCGSGPNVAVVQDGIRVKDSR
jgi:NADH:ubiquinone oxidoreductase subunit E